ncbi:MAG: FAD-dependent oxidoreductase [bacterium]|nr:FAD-dependent oxidoreductase [bacterium]
MSVTTVSGGAPAVVLGGGVAGLAAARLVARHVSRVVVLERDVRSDAAEPELAFRDWERPGVPQFRHSHAFLARLRLVLLAHMPEVLERLREIGVREITLAETAPPGLLVTPDAADEDVVLLACRRSTFEWALRESVRALPNVELREGMFAAGLVAVPGPQARPRITGVRLDDGTVVPASFVVDALGRRSPAPAWLASLGAGTPREQSTETGIFYYTRFYRLRRHKAPRGTTGLVAGDAGWVKLAIFPGDADTFSITVGTPVDDAALKRLADPVQFERFVAAFPQLAPWRTRGVSEPIGGDAGPVRVMGQLKNRMRHFVDDGGPLAAGLFVVGDAAYHSNPIYGRGCPSAMVQASLLDEVLGRHPRDLVAAAAGLHALSEQQIRPFWEAAVASDRRMRGETASPNGDTAFLADLSAAAVKFVLERGILPATRVDPVVFRGLLRIFHMLDGPEVLLRDPEMLLRTVPVLARSVLGVGPGGDFEFVPRAAVLARLDAA